MSEIASGVQHFNVVLKPGANTHKAFNWAQRLKQKSAVIDASDCAILNIIHRSVLDSCKIGHIKDTCKHYEPHEVKW
jgi:hypothetical protein